MSQELAGMAVQYVTNTDLSDIPTYSDDHLAPPPTRFVPQTDANQAVIVGSQIQTFVEGVDADKRRKTLNAMLFAQLRAQKAAGTDDPDSWYDAYFEALSNVGFVVGERHKQTLNTEAAQADVEKAVLALAASLLVGPAVTAYQVVASALGALQKMDGDSPAVTIFRRQAQHQETSFQIATVQQLEGDISLLVLAFSMQASSEVTQVLFFKARFESANVTHQSAQLGLNEEAFEAVADLIRKKVAKHMEGYVRQLDI